jgi:preprotein translocase subunit YajC
MSTVQIRAKNLKEGDRLVFTGGHTLYVDDVTYTRDGEVKVTVGQGGTGTEWFEMEDLVRIEG